MGVCLNVYLCAMCMPGRYLWRPEEGIGSPGTGVIYDIKALCEF